MKRGKLYIKSPEWLENKRATINPKNNDDKCFRYGLTVALDYDKIENHPERISNIEPFIDKYNWKDIYFPSRVKDWKNFEQNNEIIALNISYLPHNTKQRRLHTNQNITGNQVILLMITNGKKWHYLAVKNLSRLLRGITSNHNRDFYKLFSFIQHKK